MKKHIEPGSKFGRWTVMKAAPPKKSKAMFKCRCDCGNIKEVSENNLRRGLSTSCGCYRKERSLEGNHKRIKEENNENLVGKKFGRLTVLKKVEGYGCASKWLCKCECGNKKSIQQSSLINGYTRSCGCYHDEHASAKVKEYVGNVQGTNASLISSKTTFKNNTSGRRGVSFAKNVQKYHAYIMFQGKLYNLGFYKAFSDAVEAREEAEEKIYGSFLEWYAENYPKKVRKGEQ